jgi:SpoIID/LytB domain protein
MLVQIRRSLLALVVTTILASMILALRPAPAAAAAPKSFQFKGGGFGHGIGLSQYGAYGAAQAGKTAEAIISFYYGGASASVISMPTNLRVGLVQKSSTVTLSAKAAPGSKNSTLNVTGRSRTGAMMSATINRGTTYTARALSGGVAIYKGSTKVFGPTAPKSAVIVNYQIGVAGASLLTLPQAGATLRWGYLEIGTAATDTTHLRAVATMSFQNYLRGLGEVPSSWPTEALRSQAIAARSYALAKVQASGQYRGRASSTGCSCAVYSDTRDQNFVGFSKESGTVNARWVGAVTSTTNEVVTYNTKVIMAFYSASTGGYTASNAIWGGSALPYYPSRVDPYDAAGGRNPNHNWTVTRTAAQVTSKLAKYGLGTVTGLKVTSKDSSGRVKSVQVTGTKGTKTISGDAFRLAFGLLSNKVTITTV